MDDDLNYLIKLVAKDQSISEPAAWSQLRNKWTPNSQLAGILSEENISKPNASAALIDTKQSISLEKLRQDFEIKKMELDEKKDAREQCKIELAEKKLEIEKEIALARIQLEKEINASRIEMEQKRLAQKEEFDQKLLLIQANKSGQGDMFEQINQVNKLEQTFSDRMIARAEALGVDAATLKKITGSSKPEGINFNKLIDFADNFIGNAKKEQNTPSGLEPSPSIMPQQPQQMQISPEVEAQIRAETEAKAEQNKFLLQELETERRSVARYKEERTKLESKASELGIPYDNTITNQELFYWIEAQEAILGQQQKAAQADSAEKEELETQRHQLISTALDLGIPFDDTTTNEEIGDMIGKHQEVLTELQGSEPMIAVELPDAEEIPASALKVKAKQKKMRTAKELKNFTILMENPEKTFIQEIAAKSHRSAALLMAKKLKGTLEEPVRVRIKHTGEDEEKIFDTWIAEKEGKKGTVFLPRAKEIKEILEEPPEIKEADLEG